MRRAYAVAVTCFALLATGGCRPWDKGGGQGGGGGGGGGGNDDPTSITGTAAAGAPLASAAVTLVSTAGTTRTATTAADGTFSVDTTSLTPPFLVRVVSGGTTLYGVSVSAGAGGIINVTPLTDLVVQAWYRAQGAAVADAFAQPATHAPPSPAQAADLSGFVTGLVQPWLDRAGVAAGYEPLGTSFAADGTGIDQVYDWTAYQPDTLELTVTDGHLTQELSLGAYSGDASLLAFSAMSGPGGTTTTWTGTLVPTSAARQAAKDGVVSTCDAFVATVNAAGEALAAADLLPYLDAGALHGGLTQGQWAAQWAAALAGNAVSVSGIRLLSLDTGLNVARARLRLAQALYGVTAYSTLDLEFKKVGDGWLMSGDRRIAAVALRAELVSRQGAGAAAPGLRFGADVRAPSSTIQEPGVLGGPYDATRLLSAAGTTSVTWDPDVALDVFVLDEATDPDLTQGGTQFTLSMTQLSDGSHPAYQLRLDAATTEPLPLSSPTGTRLVDVLDGPVTLAWTLPETFPVSRVRIGAVTHTATGRRCESVYELAVADGAPTEADAWIDSICSERAVTSAEVYVQAVGDDGELSTARYGFQ
jgi:hypothetical protein